MEGVGARFGRSSNRYTTTTVFTGPVRRWKKKWVRLTPAHHHYSSSNGAADGANGPSHLLMYKWAPVTTSRDKDDGDNAGSDASNNDGAVSADEPPRRKFKFIPVSVLEAENNEFSEQNEDEAKPIEIDGGDATTAETESKVAEKPPDINDVPMNEIQASEDEPPQQRHDLNKKSSSLDLSLGLNGNADDDQQA